MGSAKSDLSAAFLRELNKHGYAFQAAVFRAAKELAEDGSSVWRPEVPEFPVVVHGKPAHIDLLLRAETGRHVLVVECKRVNPAYGVWCFAPSADAAGAWGGNQVTAECVQILEGLPLFASGTSVTMAPGKHYSVGLEIQTSRKGDAEPARFSSKGAIQNAVEQACRGMNGLVNYYGCRSLRKHKVTDTYFVPVVVTTADIQVCNRDLGEASLEFGEMPNSELETAPWVYFDYPQSPGMKHDFSPSTHASRNVRRLHQDVRSPHDGRSLRNEGRAEFMRTVPVVSAKSLAEFLKANGSSASG